MSHTKKVMEDTKVTLQNKEVALGFEPKPRCFHQPYQVVLVPKPNQTTTVDEGLVVSCRCYTWNVDISRVGKRWQLTVRHLIMTMCW